MLGKKPIYLLVGEQMKVYCHLLQNESDNNVFIETSVCRINDFMIGILLSKTKYELLISCSFIAF